MTDFRVSIRDRLARLMTVPDADLDRVAADLFAPENAFHAMAPVDDVAGRDAVVEHILRPLRAALTGVHRRDEIVMGGENIREGGGRWVACVSHLVGTFDATLWGVAPSARLAFLRAGEFYRVREDGLIDRAHVILDLPDLMRQAGRAPFPLLGTEMLFPGPATHDGVCPDPAGGTASLDVVQRMLGDLHVYDAVTYSSAGQTGEGGTWSDDMLWHGPGGVGSNYRWDGFVKDHRKPFIEAFPDRKGGNHYCRIGDGPYAAVSGWPSMTMTHRGPYLGLDPTDRALTLRVMDFYRVAGGRIAENWVLLDYVDLARQLGRDVLA
ncbi:ester cyclase [Jannaschia aquimarina]|uniref:SnoaL-like polyketide cyclase n=1 Tax=Jannaschia aquimarina TaxID=935700 RepID=A0A0D1EHG5_9RHOB|nr:ester cyclase [Jannaschia aquimarina]KIT16291.1 SnoaL-like polyketide cyclase [Jannaschia aquimarina]SNT14496.1 Predicted ester cyclase [Jannaschia aquimarina]